MKNGLFVFAMGLTCGVISGWCVGCTNHYEYVGGAAKANSAQKNLPSPSSSPTANQAALSAFAGSSICDDSQCAPDEVKTVNDKLGSIVTESTVRFPKAQPQSVCRVDENQVLVLNKQNGQQASGLLESVSYEVLDSAENTHDCGDYYEKINGSMPANQPLQLSLASVGTGAAKTTELSVNGVLYRQASQQELQSLIGARQAEDSRDVSIAGTWNCADDDCDGGIVTIAPDLSSMSTYQTLHVDGENQSCRIVQTSKLTIANSNDPDLVAGSLSGGNPSLVITADNTDGCADLVKNMDNDPAESGTVHFERDGNQVLYVNGQRFMRAVGGDGS